MNLTSGSSDKALKGLTIIDCYRRIHDWHTGNNQRIMDKFSYRKPNDPYTICYQRLVTHLPDPEEATREDIVFVCIEVISGLMEWAYHEKDENGIKTSTYAHYVLNTFFDGFNGKETRDCYQKSPLQKKFSMVNCLANIRPSPIDGYLEELLRAPPDRVEHIVQLLLRRSKDDVENVVDAAVDKILMGEYDGSKWSTLAFSISTSFGKHKEVSKILEELVKKEPENAAYYNNLGINYFLRELYGSAAKSFAEAYALDYKAHGKKAAELPAWKNLTFLCSSLDRSKASITKK